MMALYDLDTKVNVLGTQYRVRIQAEQDEPRLKYVGGFTDKTSKLIVVDDMSNGSDLDNPCDYLMKIIRHELIHAFLYESGLAENWKHPEDGHEEMTVDWFAIQMPKIQKAVDEVFRELKLRKDVQTDA